MKIGLLADSHDRVPALAAALRRFDALGVQATVHAGDLISPFAAALLAARREPRHVVFGNNDGERAGLSRVLPGIQDGPLRLELAGRRVLVHHFIDWCAPHEVAAADVVLTGHTHVAGVERRGGTLLVNPGECCGWVGGRCTIAVVDLARLDAEIIEVST